MKIHSITFRLTSSVAVLAVALAAAGCNSNSSMTADRKPIPLAPVGVASSGIGGPGGDSADTRAVGSVATGEGNQESDIHSGVGQTTATAPGSVRAAPGRN